MTSEASRPSPRGTVPLGADLVRELETRDPASACPRPGALFALLVLAAVATYAVSAVLSLRLNVNWDEFHYLSYVYDAQRGVLSYAWATFHVHLFGWLARVGANEVDRVIVARLVYFLLSAGTGYLLYRVARRFLGREASLVSLLAFLTFSYVLRHGTSFRPDPLCALLLVFALDHLLPGKRKPRAVLAGVAMAVSLLITIKAALHLALVAAILALLLLASPGSRPRVLRLATRFAAGFAATFLPLLVFHRSLVDPTETARSTTFLSGAASKVFGTGLLFPRRRVVLEALDQNPLFWLLLAGGIALALAMVLRPGDASRARPLLLLLLAAPVATLAVYRNAFPYYYVFMLPTVSIIAGLPVQVAMTRGSRRMETLARGLALVVAFALGSGGLALLRARGGDETAVQRQLLTVVHRMFPRPVPYIDRCSMVSSFPKVGFFMSSWGLQRYRETGVPSFRALLAERPVPFLIANTISLRLDLPDRVLAGHPYSLLREDLALIRDNFVHHWGLIFVQGKRFDFVAQPGPREFEILSGGPFTLEAEGAVEIDGVAVNPGTIVELAAGPHVAVAGEGTRGAVLRWGERLWRPDFPPLTAPIFLDL